MAGKVEIRLNERQMRNYLNQVAAASVQGAAASCAKAAQRRVVSFGLIDSGALRDSIKSARAGRLHGVGAIARVYVDGSATNRQGVAVGAYALAQHDGHGPIIGNPYLYLKYRRNSRAKSIAGKKVWRTQRTSGIPAHPFLRMAAQALRERDFAYLKAPGVGKRSDGGFSKFLKSVGNNTRGYGG